MNARRPDRGGSSPLVVPGLAIALALAAACPARAQHRTTDPYNPYGAAYLPYAVPTYMPRTDMYGRNLAPGGSGMNQLDRYFEANGLGYGAASPADGLFTTPGRSNRPYYQAYRQYDRAYGRTITPSDADLEFYRSREERARAYREALHEPDPRERARRLQAVERMSVEAARDVPAAARSARPARAAAPAARPSASRAARATPTTPRAATSTRPDTTRRPASPAPSASSLRPRSGQNLRRSREARSNPTPGQPTSGARTSPSSLTPPTRPLQ